MRSLLPLDGRVAEDFTQARPERSGPGSGKAAGVDRVPEPPRPGQEWTLKADSRGFSFRIAGASLANNARIIFQRYLAAQAAAGSDVYGAELIFGELLGNVARHAPGAIDVHLRWNGAVAILEVSDHGPGYSVDDVRLPGDYAESRRGLFLVSSFGRDLKVRHENGRTTTTVTLPVSRRGVGGVSTAHDR
jgi:anti-sigma regulatory factor (Ser/Thr protein kinase)